MTPESELHGEHRTLKKKTLARASCFRSALDNEERRQIRTDVLNLLQELTWNWSDSSLWMEPIIMEVRKFERDQRLRDIGNAIADEADKCHGLLGFGVKPDYTRLFKLMKKEKDIRLWLR